MLEKPQDFRQSLIDHRRELLAYARRLTGDGARAEDLVQETILKALQNEAKFVLGTNLRAWLYRILKNTFLSELRKEKSASKVDFDDAIEPVSAASQLHYLALREIFLQIGDLPDVQRKLVKLVGVLGWSYEEAAAICDCEIGTVKSRLSRARSRLAFGTDWRVDD